jgi:hypothetical protein
MALEDVSDVADPAVQRHLVRISGELSDVRADMRAQVTGLRQYMTEGLQALAAMIAASTEALRAGSRVLMEHIDGGFDAQDARLDTHLRDPNAHRG